MSNHQARSGETFPGWSFRPVPKSAKGYLVTIGPENSPLPDPKPRVHIVTGTGLTNCGINTQLAPRGHRTYGLQYKVVESIPPPRTEPPRAGQPFVLCSKC